MILQGMRALARAARLGPLGRVLVAAELDVRPEPPVPQEDGRAVVVAEQRAVLARPPLGPRRRHFDLLQHDDVLVGDGGQGLGILP